MYIRKANQTEFYPKGVVEFFLNLHNDAVIKKDLEDDKVYVAIIEDKIIATITIDQNEISRFFVLTDYQKYGYGSQILDAVEKIIFEKSSFRALLRSNDKENECVYWGWIFSNRHDGNIFFTNT